MFEGFDSFSVKTQDSPQVYISGLKTPSAAVAKPPLLLLHGFPQTHHIWHVIAPRLKPYFSLVIPSLRGYGTSSKPAQDVAQYAKSVMAKDFITLMGELGYDGEFYVCGHDRGARVAHKLCVDHPSRIKKAIFLDILPTLSMWNSGNPEFPKKYYHWYLLTQNHPLPELLLSSAPPSQLATQLLGNFTLRRDMSVFSDGVVAEYVKSFKDADTIHGWCQEYRASATVDCDEAKEDIKENRLIRCPVRVFIAKGGVLDSLFDAQKEWAQVTVSDVEVRRLQSGHFMPEEVPDDVVLNILDFFH